MSYKILLISITFAVFLGGSAFNWHDYHNDAFKEYHQDDVQSIDFCQLVSTPDKYNKKVVRIQAIMVTTFDDSYLYNLSCNDTEHLISSHYDCNSPSACKELSEKINENSEGDLMEAGSRVELVAVGEFIVVDSGILDQTQGQNKKILLFNIQSIEQTISVPTTTSFPGKRRSEYKGKGKAETH